MVLSNAERQARYLQRLKTKVASGVTPDDINRARRIVYEHYASDPANRAPSWDEWVAECRKPKNRGRWSDMVPQDGDPEMWDEFGEHAEFLAKVGAVIEAINKVSD